MEWPLKAISVGIVANVILPPAELGVPGMILRQERGILKAAERRRRVTYEFVVQSLEPPSRAPTSLYWPPGSTSPGHTAISAWSLHLPGTWSISELWHFPARLPSR